MRHVTMDKAEFREIVEKNKEEHEQEFHEACAAFYETLKEKLSEVFAAVEAGKMNYREAMDQLYFGMDCPQGYCDQYQEVLDQLEHEVGETVTLDANEFKMYVKDEWHWKQAFAASYHSSTGGSIEISKSRNSSRL